MRPSLKAFGLHLVLVWVFVGVSWLQPPEDGFLSLANC